MEDIEHYDIPIYNFPYDVEEDDEDTIIDNSELRVRIHVFRKKEGVNMTSLHRTCSPLVSLALRRKLRSMASSSVLVSTLGAMRKSTTPSTLTSAVSGLLCSSNYFLSFIRLPEPK